jgi:hypothetical protein
LQPLDQDSTTQKLRERGRWPQAGGERRRTTVLALGCPFCHADYAWTKHASARTSLGRQGGRRSGGDGAKGGGAFERSGASPATLPRHCGAPRRKRTAPTGPLPCGEAPGDLHGHGRAADEVAHGGGGARVWRRRGASPG